MMFLRYSYWYWAHAKFCWNRSLLPPSILQRNNFQRICGICHLSTSDCSNKDPTKPIPFVSWITKIRVNIGCYFKNMGKRKNLRVLQRGGSLFDERTAIKRNLLFVLWTIQEGSKCRKDWLIGVNFINFFYFITKMND
jgi:hypothetical protein